MANHISDLVDERLVLVKTDADEKGHVHAAGCSCPRERGVSCRPISRESVRGRKLRTAASCALR